MNVFQRAAKGLPLNPAERAMLKLGEGLIIAAILAALPAALLYISGLMASHPTGLDVKSAAAYVGGLFLTALITAITKYVKSHFDGPIADAAISVLQQAEDYALHFGGIPNDPKFEPNVADLPDVTQPAPQA